MTHLIVTDKTTLSSKKRQLLNTCCIYETLEWFSWWLFCGFSCICTCVKVALCEDPILLASLMNTLEQIISKVWKAVGAGHVFSCMAVTVVMLSSWTYNVWNVASVSVTFPTSFWRPFPALGRQYLAVPGDWVIFFFEPASRGHFRHCTFWHLFIGFSFIPRVCPLVLPPDQINWFSSHGLKQSGFVSCSDVQFTVFSSDAICQMTQCFSEMLKIEVMLSWC